MILWCNVTPDSDSSSLSTVIQLSLFGQWLDSFVFMPLHRPYPRPRGIMFLGCPSVCQPFFWMWLSQEHFEEFSHNFAHFSTLTRTNWFNFWGHRSYFKDTAASCGSCEHEKTDQSCRRLVLINKPWPAQVKVSGTYNLVSAN